MSALPEHAAGQELDIDLTITQYYRALMVADAEIKSRTGLRVAQGAKLSYAMLTARETDHLKAKRIQQRVTEAIEPIVIENIKPFLPFSGTTQKYVMWTLRVYQQFRSTYPGYALTYFPAFLQSYLSTDEGSKLSQLALNPEVAAEINSIVIDPNSDLHRTLFLHAEQAGDLVTTIINNGILTAIRYASQVHQNPKITEEYEEINYQLLLSDIRRRAPEFADRLEKEISSGNLNFLDFVAQINHAIYARHSSLKPQLVSTSLMKSCKYAQEEFSEVITNIWFQNLPKNIGELVIDVELRELLDRILFIFRKGFQPTEAGELDQLILLWETELEKLANHELADKFQKFVAVILADDRPLLFDTDIYAYLWDDSDLVKNRLSTIVYLLGQVSSDLSYYQDGNYADIDTERLPGVET